MGRHQTRPIWTCSGYHHVTLASHSISQSPFGILVPKWGPRKLVGAAVKIREEAWHTHTRHLIHCDHYYYCYYHTGV